MELRYVVARLVPDLIRDEPINVGVILQSDKWVDCRFLEKIPKDWGLDESLEKDVATELNQAWKDRLSVQSEVIYFPDLHQHRSVSYTDKAFLEWIQHSYARHLQFSDIREAEINVSDAFDFETFLHKLYSIFVAPKPRPRRPVVRSRLHTAVKHEFAQLKLPVHEQIRERDVILGTFPWTVDFAYKVNGNGSGRRHEVGIGLVDLSSPHFLERAKDLLAKWADVKNVRSGEVTRISVVGGFVALDEQQQTLQMLTPYSDELYVFDLDQEKERLLWRVANDLIPLLDITTAQ